MELIKQAIDFVLHIDRYMTSITAEYGTLTYVILFVIIFAETGLVVTPFLPGDSLLFAIGAIAALGNLDLAILLGALSVAAILGDTVNYWVGNFFKQRILQGEKIKFINEEHLNRTREFYNRYGGKTIVIGRFIPIVRTFAPFVAGIGAMNYSQFIVYNILGGILWIVSFTLLGFFFGNLPIVKRYFTLVIFAIIIISVLPAVVEFFRTRKKT